MRSISRDMQASGLINSLAGSGRVQSTEDWPSEIYCLSGSFHHGLLRAETLGQNLKIRNRELELGLHASYVYFI